MYIATQKSYHITMQTNMNAFVQNNWEVEHHLELGDFKLSPLGGSVFHFTSL